ncbi:MAG TPA: AAA family ATPase, partial [Gaiellaceae bacterium]
MAKVEIDLLGGFAARLDGAAVEPNAWRLRKARDLVKLLALAPRHRLHREQVMDALWPDRGPGSAANNLNQAVHAARRALGHDAILLRDEVLSLEAEVDVDRFEAAAAGAVRAGSAAACRAALALYPGELLPENRYDDWAEARRARAAELAARLDEAAAGAAPSERFEVPASTSSFVGRRHELEELSSLLERTRLLTLAGTGGAGKTRLALELARRTQAHAAGAAFVELAPVREQRHVGQALADALDVRALPGQDPLDAAVEFLRTRSLLLVLDNCEHVLGAAAVASERVLRDAPSVSIVVTSREPLRLAAEFVFRVPSLDLPDPDRLLSPAALLEYEAVSLFVARAQAASGFELDEHNAPHVVRICRRLDGLPLALELAAGRIGALTPAAVAERLDHRFELLRTGSLASPTRQQTLQATLDWSHELLDDDEATLFRRLAIFSGGFTLEAVERVCGGDETSAPAVADVLARLVEKSLVAVEDRPGERRYRLLETVRLYARARLAAAGEEPTLADRHAAWALALAESARGAAVLDRDQGNLRAALRTLLASRPRDGLRMAAALLPFWLRRIELAEGRRQLAEALAASPEETALACEALLAAAAIEFRSAALAAGEELVERSRAVASSIGDARREWRAAQ